MTRNAPAIIEIEEENETFKSGASAALHFSSGSLKIGGSR